MKGPPVPRYPRGVLSVSTGAGGAILAIKTAKNSHAKSRNERFFPGAGEASQDRQVKMHLLSVNFFIFEIWTMKL